MDIVDFFNGGVLELPKERPPGDFEAFFDQMLAAFVAEVGQISDHNPVSDGIRAAAPTISQLCQHLRAAIDAYLDGFPHGAYEQLQQGIALIRPHVDNLSASPVMANALQLLYRVRLGNLATFSRQELFHIPFELRHLVTSKRYSISGLPSLYLGGSLWVCWEELGRPDFHAMHVAQFRAAKNVSVLDFGYRPALIAAMLQANPAALAGGGPLADFAVSQGVCWPLIAACSIKVLRTGSPFIPEYVIPQLLLQWLRNSTPIHGLRYFSTKIRQYVRYPTVSMNYVFPVRQRAAMGYCPDLRNRFELSDPIAWAMLKQAGLPRHHPRNPTWQMRLADGVEVAYLHTDFWDCESKLDLFPCHTI